MTPHLSFSGIAPTAGDTAIGRVHAMLHDAGLRRDIRAAYTALRAAHAGSYERVVDRIAARAGTMEAA